LAANLLWLEASMSNRSVNRKTYVHGIASFEVGQWTPYETAFRWSSLAFSAYSTMGSELQEFVARRTIEDFSLLRRLAHCRAQHEVVAAYSDFWRKAADDYGKEATTLAKLMISAANRMAAVGQPTTVTEPRTVQLREAAE
jgi:hypothetical protein